MELLFDLLWEIAGFFLFLFTGKKRDRKKGKEDKDA